jgi:hypothetical protein
MAGIESCQEVYGEREMRPARRFTGKGDETCQEVYGEREMLRGWDRKLPGGLRGKGDETC